MKKPVADTISSIYAAVGKREAWSGLVGELGSLFGATTSMFVATGQGQRDYSFYASHGHSERLARAYSDHWWQHDVWLQAGLKQNQYFAGNVRIGTDLVCTAALRASAFYTDFLLAMPAEHLLVAIVADGSEAAPGFEKIPPTHISFFRPPAGVPFTPADKAKLAALLPHLSRAFAMDCQWRAMQEQLDVFHTSVDSMDFGLIFVDAAGHVRHANSAACALAKRLWPENSDGIGAILQLPVNMELKRLYDAAALGVGGALTLQANGPKRAQAVDHAVTVAMTASNPGANHPGNVRSSVLLLIVDSDRRPDAAADFLSKAFLLSKAESRLLPLLIKGFTPTEIAKALEIKLPTVRSQLSSIFAKTDTARQQDLIALASAMPQVASSQVAVLGH